MNKAIPELRFPEFSGEWKEYRLEEVSDIKTGPFGSTLHQEDYVDIGTPIITVEHLGEYGITKQNLPLVSDEDKQRLKSYLLKSGDIVFSRVGSVDRSSLIKDDENGWLFSGRLLRVRLATESFSAIFLNQLFKNEYVKHRIRSVAVGQTMPSLNTQILKNFHLFFPILKKEQQKIADFLTAIDEKITILTDKITQLESYKRGMMQKLLSGELRFPGFRDVWREVKLGEIATFSKGKGISKKDIDDNGTVECIRYGELYTEYGEVITKISSRISLDVSDLVLSKANDIIIPASGETQVDIATASCVMKDNVALSGDINIIRTAENGIFLAYYLNSAKKIDIAKLAQGISVVHLYAAQLKTLKLELPSLPEQQKIADFLTAIDDKLTIEQEKLDQLKHYKQGLLQKMFV